MSVLNENTIIGASAAGGDYEIEQSLRFDEPSNSHLSRTFPSSGNLKTWTWSAWVKRGKFGGQQMLFAPVTNGNGIYFESNGILTFEFNTPNNYKQTSAVFRDPSAWYHIVAVWNTTSGTAEDRIQIYINGERVTAFSGSSLPSQNRDSIINSAQTHNIGDRASDQGAGFDGYIGEVNFIDGQALTADSFGETGDYGEWKPTKFNGTYGTNGFYLPFKQDYTVEGFSTVVYEANTKVRYVGGVGFEADFLWFKNRTRSSPHRLVDTLRGLPKTLSSNTTGAEATGLSDGTVNRLVTSVTADGFNLGIDDGGYRINSASGDDMVAWNWDMGSTTASNTAGSITTSVRANTTYGQSIVSYTGNATSGATVGHGLSSAPTFVISKVRNQADYNWNVYHSGLGNAAKVLHLDLNAEASTETNKFNGTAPSSSVVTLGNHGTNVSGKTQILYCFHDVANYSKFSSYSGNGSATGPVITLGFSPAFVMIKRSNAAEHWKMYDNVRNPFNPVNTIINANEADAEATSVNNTLDFTATGFQCTSTSGATNASGSSYVYMAFADTREYAYWLDQSGNNNDWESEGGLTESDVMVDSPTNNFATFNPLDTSGNITFSNGNLEAAQVSPSRSRGTIGSQVDGKIYFEFYNPRAISNSSVMHVGLNTMDANIHSASDFANAVGGANVMTYFGGNDYWVQAHINGSAVGSVINVPEAKIGAGGIVSFASDSATGKVWMAINNRWLKANGQFDGTNALSSSNYLYQLTAGLQWTPCTFPINFTELGLNCGQDSSFGGRKTPQGNQDSNAIGDFFYPVPSGFLALCTKSLPSVDVIPSENFNTVLYTGNGSPASHTLGFRPNLVWGKKRNAAQNNWLINDVGSINKWLSSDSSNAEGSEAYGTTFNTNGFTTANNDLFINNGGTYAAWGWKGNGTGTAVSNTNGSVTSQVSANVEAGFSIATFTLPTTATTIGHGLSKPPELIFQKGRVSGSAWWTFAKPVGNTKALRLDTTTNAVTSSNFWNNTDPTSTLVTIGANSGGNNSWLMYCFHSVDGYSKVGSYIGNGSATAGPFVHCGFKPAFVLIKRSNAAQDWYLWDTKRSPINPVAATLSPNSNGAEGDRSSLPTDVLSNGFKIRNTSIGWNGNGDTYIFYAIAETPFKNSNAH